jgi:hypothetical protein
MGMGDKNGCNTEWIQIVVGHSSDDLFAGSTGIDQQIISAATDQRRIAFAATA